MSSQAARFVGTIPENYDRGLGPQIFGGYAKDLARRAAALAPTRVLELAAGTGILTRYLRDALEDSSEIIASDLNPPMLEVAAAKFQAGESVQFEQIDAMNIEHSEATFDLVICQFGVMFFPDKTDSYAEVCRVLVQSGSYIFNVWGSWDANPFAKITHDAVAKFFPDDPPGFYKIPFGYHNEDEIRESLLQAGFATVDFERLKIESEIPSSKEFAKGLVFGNPLYDEVVSRGGDPHEICTAVGEAIDTQLGEVMSLEAVIVHASKS